MIDLMKKSLGWNEIVGDKIQGWARQLGTDLNSTTPTAIVIGTGAGSAQELVNNFDGSVMLGAHSTKPSIVISPGTVTAAGSVAIGHDAAAIGARSASFGPSAKAEKDDSLAMGNATEAKHAGSMVVGSGVDAQQKLTSPFDDSVALGAHSTKPSIVISSGSQSRAGSVAIGHEAATAGDRSVSLGAFANAEKDDSLSIGYATEAKRDGAMVIGSGADDKKKLSSTSDDSVALGAYSTKPSIVISPGFESRAGSVAIGHDAAATGARSVSLGPSAKAEEDDSVAMGYATEAKHAGSMVIGSGVDAEHKLTSHSDKSVALGAGSAKPSIVISPGDDSQAGGVAIGANARAKHPQSVVIGVGLPNQTLENDNPNTVVLGAGSSKPSLIIQAGKDANTPGEITLCADLVAGKGKTLSLGSNEGRIDRLYVSNNSIHIGINDKNEGTIGYDEENSRLRLGHNVVVTGDLALTGFSDLEETNFLALDNGGKFKVATVEIKRQVERAKTEADRAEGKAGDASASARDASAAASRAEAAKSGASTAETAANTAAGRAAASATGAAASATGAAAAAEAAVAAAVAGSLAGIATSLTAAQTARGGAEKARDEAEQAKNQALQARFEAQQAKAEAQRAAEKAEEARGEAVRADAEAQRAATAAAASAAGAERSNALLLEAVTKLSSQNALLTEKIKYLQRFEFTWEQVLKNESTVISTPGGYMMGADGNGNIYVCNDEYILKATDFGILYSRFYQFNSPPNVHIKALAADHEGNVYVISGSQVFELHKYGSDGSRVARGPAPDSGYNVGAIAAKGPRDFVYVPFWKTSGGYDAGDRRTIFQPWDVDLLGNIYLCARESVYVGRNLSRMKPT
ncbi:MAG: hypothetical protein ACLPIG_09535 [Methylocella sp.]